MRLFTVCIVSSAALLVSLATIEPVQAVRGQGFAVVGNDGPYGGYHASTAAEGAARGLADIIRSQGLANKLNAEAATEFQHANRLALENAEKWVDTYFATREKNRAYRASERGPRPTSSDLIRYSKARLPERLSPSDVDVLSGTIYWPLLLQEQDLAADRKQIEQLVDKWVSTGKLSPREYLQLRRRTDAMKGALRERIEQMPPADYLAARSFLESLAYEAHLGARELGRAAVLSQLREPDIAARVPGELTAR